MKTIQCGFCLLVNVVETEESPICKNCGISLTRVVPDYLSEFAQQSGRAEVSTLISDARAESVGDPAQWVQGQRSSIDVTRTPVAEHAVPPTMWVLELESGFVSPMSQGDVVVGSAPSPIVPGASCVQVHDPGGTVAGNHALLRLHAGCWWVQDLGSLHGTVIVDDAGVTRQVPQDQMCRVIEYLAVGSLRARIRVAVPGEATHS